MNFVFEQIRTGGDRNFAYLVGDRSAGEAVIVDPSFDPDRVVDRAAAQGLTVTHIVNTHGHPDHTNGNERARERTGAPLAAHGSASPDVVLADEGRLVVGGFALIAHETPGHADDHLCLVVDDVCLSGDLLFVGKVGGTANDDAAAIEFESLRRLFGRLPDETTVWPGHDYGSRPSSTLGLERRTNPFVRCETLAEFLDLKRTWAEYKRSHGLA